MNGRIYDPTLGRFLQADPFVQFPNNSQSYNRYSYVLNNPMSYTDPSGYFLSALNPIKKIFRNAIRAVSKIIGPELTNIFGSIGSALLCGPLCAGEFQYHFIRAMGGSSSGALRGAFTAAASAFVFQQIGAKFNGAEGTWNAANGPLHIAAHAVTGGIISDLQGGKFGHGFFSAGLTKGLNINGIVGTTQGAGWDALRIVVAAAVGGTISKVTGGKFGNGAVTAAFAQAFNGNKYAKREDAVKRALKTLKKDYRLINKDSDLFEHPAKRHRIGTYVTEVTEREGGFLGLLGGEEKTYYVASEDATINGADFFEHMSTSLAGAQSSPEGVTDWFLASPNGGSPDFRFATSVGVQSIYNWNVKTGLINHYTYSGDTRQWSCSAYGTGGKC